MQQSQVFGKLFQQGFPIRSFGAAVLLKLNNVLSNPPLGFKQLYINGLDGTDFARRVGRRDLTQQGLVCLCLWGQCVIGWCWDASLRFTLHGNGSSILFEHIPTLLDHLSHLLLLLLDRTNVQIKFIEYRQKNISFLLTLWAVQQKAQPSRLGFVQGDKGRAAISPAFVFMAYPH